MSEEIKLHLIQRVMPPDPLAEKRKRDRENGRIAALEFANEALLETVAVMRSTKDPSIKLKAAKEIMNRAWGTPKNVEDESKAMANRSMLEVLATISTELAALEHQPDAPVLEQTNFEDEDALEALLLPDDAENEQDE